MAKKIDYTLDDFGFDSELDNFDFDFDSKSVKDDRNPVTKVAVGFAKGVRKGVSNESFITGAIRNLLPRGYGTATDSLLGARNTIRDLYNSSAEELRPVVNDLKRLTGKAVPSGERYIPGSLAKSLTNWSDTQEKESNRYSYESNNDIEMNRSLAEVFKIQAQEYDKKDNERDFKDQLREGLSFTKHREAVGQLNEIRLSTSRLASYQEKITANYQRKSLELQYRHFFVARDAFVEQQRHHGEMKSYLGSINKNTALPDYVKLKQSERLGEALRNRFIDDGLSGIIGQRSDFVHNVGSRLKKNVVGNVKDFASGLRQGISGAEMALDSYESAKEMGMGGGQDPYKTTGDFVGSVTPSLLTGSRYGNRLRSKISKNETVSKLGNQLQYHGQNLPQYANEFAHSSWGSFGLGRFLVNPLKDAILDGREGRHVDMDNVKNLQEPGIFTRQTNKSINEVIPGLLSKIHHELHIIRSGDINVEPLSYDYTRNQFQTDSITKSNLIKTVINPGQKDYVRKEVDDLINKIDPDKTLDEDARIALGKQLLNDNMNNRIASPDRLSNQYSYLDDAGKYADQYTQLFSEYFKDDDNYEKRAGFSERYNDLGRFVNIDKSQIQDIVNSGQAGILGDAGILSMGGADNRDPSGYIDYAKYFNYYYSDSYVPGKSTPKGMSPLGGMPRPPSPSGLGGTHHEFPDFTNDPLGESKDNEDQPKGLLNKNIIRSYKLDGEDRSSIINAINAISPIQLLSLANTTLESIDTKLGMGIPTFTSGPIDSETLRKYIEQTTKGDITKRKGIIGKLFTGAKDIVTGLYNTATSGGKLTDKVLGGLFSGGIAATGFLFNNAIKAGGLLLRGKKEIRDLFIKGKEDPLLEEWKLKAGHYYDSVTGEVITSFENIKNPIMENGKVVATLEQLKETYTKTKTGFKPFKLLSSIGRAGNTVVNSFLSSAHTTSELITGGINKGRKWLFDKRDGSQEKEAKEGVENKDESTTPKTSSRFASGLSGLLGLGSVGKDFLGAAGGFLGKGVSEGIGNFTKLFSFALSPVFRGKQIEGRLTSIYKLLDERMPGKQIRKGSYEDQLNEEKEKEAEENMADRLGNKTGGDWGSSIYGLGAAGIASLLNRLKKKGDKEDSEESTTGDTVAAAAGGAAAAGILGKAWQGIKKVGGYGKKLGGGKVGKVLNLGGKLLKLAPGISIASGLMGTLSDGPNLLDTASIVGGIATSAVARTATMMLAKAALTGGAAVLGAISAPVALVGLGVAAVGTGGYMLYRHLTRKTLQPLSTVRFAQYGFSPGNEDQFKTILSLEEIMEKCSTFSDRTQTRLKNEAFTKAIPEILKLFGVSKDKEEQFYKLNVWFLNRFKPIWSRHNDMVKRHDKDFSVIDTDDKLKEGEKLAFLDYVADTHAVSSYYKTTVSPFANEEELKVTEGDIEALVERTRSSLEVVEGEDSPGFFSNLFGFGNKEKSTPTHGVTTDNDTSDAVVKDTSKPWVSTLDSVLTNATKALPFLFGATASIGMGARIYNSIFGSEMGFINKIRFAQYGFSPEDKDSLKALSILDDIAPKFLTESNGKMQLILNDKISIEKIVTAFKLNSKNKEELDNFDDWLKNRYTPVLVTHIQALKTLNKRPDVLGADKVLTKLEKSDYLDFLSVDATPYNITISPFPKGSKLIITGDDVNLLMDEARKELDKSKEDENEGVLDKTRNFFGNLKNKLFGDKVDESTDPSSTTNTTSSSSTSPTASSSTNQTTSSSPGSFTAGVPVGGSGSESSSSGGVDRGALLPASDGSKLPTSSAGTRAPLKGNGVANRRIMIAAAKEAGITDPKELAMILAQTDHESAGFTRLEENLRYSASNLRKTFGKYVKTDEQAKALAAAGPEAIGTLVYGGRNENNTTGDGWTYRGRGFIQLTGRANYTAAGRDLGLDLVNNPDLASIPENAAKIAVWYWRQAKSNPGHAKNGDVTKVSAYINAGHADASPKVINGLPDRKKLYLMYLSQSFEDQDIGPVEPSAASSGSATAQSTDPSAPATQSSGGIQGGLLNGVNTPSSSPGGVSGGNSIQSIGASPTSGGTNEGYSAPPQSIDTTSSMTDKEKANLQVIKIIREPSSDSGTFGKLIFPDGTSFETLELPWRENLRQKSCIPPGKYLTKIKKSPKFGNVYEVNGVPGRSAILIHPGNTAGNVDKGQKSDVLGCILLGTGRGKLGEQESVTNSKTAIGAFMAKLNGAPFLLEITGGVAAPNEQDTIAPTTLGSDGLTKEERDRVGGFINPALSSSVGPSVTSDPISTSLGGGYGGSIVPSVNSPLAAEPQGGGEPTSSFTGFDPRSVVSRREVALQQRQSAADNTISIAPLHEIMVDGVDVSRQSLTVQKQSLEVLIKIAEILKATDIQTNDAKTDTTTPSDSGTRGSGNVTKGPISLAKRYA